VTSKSLRVAELSSNPLHTTAQSGRQLADARINAALSFSLVSAASEPQSRKLWFRVSPLLLRDLVQSLQLRLPRSTTY
jgi:hypothetical protein